MPINTIASSNALVSVVLPVYNQEAYLPASLDSVFTQTYMNYELIVVDDGSTDSTPEILAEYQQQHRFIVIRQSNAGLPGALNTGFTKAQGEYLTWTSSDNIMLPDMLQVLVQGLDSDRTVGLVYADRYLIDDDGNDLGLLNVPDYDPYLLLHTDLVQCCFLYRRECMTQVGLYDPEFVYGEDWEYWIRISQFYAMKRVPKALYRYRLHRRSMTSEIMHGTARSMGYDAFASRIRDRMPIRCMIGKLKWR